MTTPIEVKGSCAPGFEGVREEFARGFAERDELGAGLAVLVDGVPVVDLWGGWVDEQRTRPWEPDTLVVVHSVTKGLVSMCVHMLAARGLIDFDARVADYWPEFGAAGKGEITFRQVISHQAGLPVVDSPLAPGATLQWETMVHALEAQAPIWAPGTRHGYHAATWGWLVGEVIRRVTGRTPGTFLREELAGPWGLDFHLGFGPELDHRVSPTAPPPPAIAGMAGPPPTPLRDRTFSLGTIEALGEASARAHRAAEIPAGNGHGTAMSIARAFGGMARGGELDGVRLVPESQVAMMHEEQVRGTDEVLGMESRYGLGFWLPAGMLTPHRGPRCFHHPGVGGALGLADPDLKLGIGYAMNRTGAAVRRMPLERAIYAALGV